MQQNDERSVKVVFVGDSFCGKTTLVGNLLLPPRCNDDEFYSTEVIREEVVHSYKGEYVRMYLWDTSNSVPEQRKVSYAGAGVVVIVFSLVDRESFRNIERKWVKEVRERADCPFILVGTKYDLLLDEDAMVALRQSNPKKGENTEPVSTKEAVELAEKVKAQNYIQTCRTSNASETVSDITVLNDYEKVVNECIKIALGHDNLIIVTKKKNFIEKIISKIIPKGKKDSKYLRDSFGKGNSKKNKKHVRSGSETWKNRSKDIMKEYKDIDKKRKKVWKNSMETIKRLTKKVMELENLQKKLEKDKNSVSKKDLKKLLFIEEDAEIERICTICYSYTKNACFEPCKHQLCENCAKKIIDMKNGCCFCKRKIVKYTLIES